MQRSGTRASSIHSRASAGGAPAPRRLAARTATVGVISDTHGLLRPEALAALAGVDVIVHAGDIGSAAVLDALRAIAPVIAVRGNNDRGAWAASIPKTVTTEVGPVRLHVVHDVNTLRGDPADRGIDVVIAGHSHRPSVERRGRWLLVNPGSAGPRRFSLPIAVARLHLGPGGARARVIQLDGAPRRVTAPRRASPAR
jgi:putative phosphoesterase